MKRYVKDFGGPSLLTLGCPRCGDSGKVGGLNRWTRRRLGPELVGLIRTGWSFDQDESDYLDRFAVLAARSGLAADLGERLRGYPLFVDDGRDGVLVALVEGQRRDDPRGRWTLLLLDPDGKVLDQLRVDSLAPPRAKVRATWSLESLALRSLEFERVDDAPLSVGITRGTEEIRTTTRLLRLHPRNGRFEVVP